MNYLIYTLLCLMLSGCYTFTGTTLPSHLKTIRVKQVINKTLDPLLAEKLTQSIIDGFQSKSTLRAVNEQGHCELFTVLKSYSHEPYNTSGLDVVDYQINMVVSVQFMDKVKDKLIFEEENLPGFGTYSISKGQTENDGQKMAMNNIVDLIIDNTISGW